MPEGDQVVVLDRDRRRGVIEVVDLTRLPGPTVRVGFDDGQLPDTGWYYETNLAVLRSGYNHAITIMPDGSVDDPVAYLGQNEPPVPGGTTAIVNGQYVRTERWHNADGSCVLDPCPRHGE